MMNNVTQISFKKSVWKMCHFSLKNVSLDLEKCVTSQSWIFLDFIRDWKQFSIRLNILLNYILNNRNEISWIEIRFSLWWRHKRSKQSSRVNILNQYNKDNRLQEIQKQNDCSLYTPPILKLKTRKGNRLQDLQKIRKIFYKRGDF